MEKFPGERSSCSRQINTFVQRALDRRAGRSPSSDSAGGSKRVGVYAGGGFRHPLFASVSAQFCSFLFWDILKTQPSSPNVYKHIQNNINNGISRIFRKQGGPYKHIYTYTYVSLYACKLPLLLLDVLIYAFCRRCRAFYPKPFWL